MTISTGGLFAAFVLKSWADYESIGASTENEWSREKEKDGVVNGKGGKEIERSFQAGFGVFYSQTERLKSEERWKGFS